MALGRRSAVSLGLLSLSVSLACGSSGSSPQEELAQRLAPSAAPDLTEESRFWPELAVPVCWEREGNDAEKALVRSAVEETWSKNSALSFSGWGVCPKEFPGLRIDTTSVWPHTFGLGTQLRYRPSGVVIPFSFDFARHLEAGVTSGFEFCNASEKNRLHCIRTMAVHEFGHALGFDHEPFYDGYHGCNGKPKGTEDHGPWAPLSFDHYCEPSLENDGFLSFVDVEPLQAHYGRPVALAPVTRAGRADAIVVNGDGVHARASTGSSFDPNRRMTVAAYYGQLGTYFADVTGDGLADAIVVNRDAITVRPSNGTSFDAGAKWTQQPYWGNLLTAFADVDGDGKADAIAVNERGIAVRRSTGASFGGAEAWTDGSFVGGRGTLFADVDGDRRADAIAVGAEKVVVRRSTRMQFGAAESWTTQAYYGARGTFAADVTGDGKADLVVVNNDAIVVRRSDGSTFAANERWTDNPYHGELGTYLVDVTGDGRADAVVVNQDRVVVRRSTGSSFAANETWIDGPFHGLR